MPDSVGFGCRFGIRHIPKNDLLCVEWDVKSIDWLTMITCSVADSQRCCLNLAAQLMAVPALGALALGAGAIVASVGSLVLPFYAGYKLHKRLERRRSAKRRRRAREAMWRKLEDMRWRGRQTHIHTDACAPV